MNILLLEDDKLFGQTIEDFLEDEGFSVDFVLDPYSAYDLAYEKSYDLYIFDINLPFEDGIKALKSLRDSGDTTATIFITSRDDKESLVSGFKVGAQDYLKKPIDLDELLLRVYAVTNRKVTKQIVVENYIIDKEKLDVFYKGRALNFTIKEFLLLELLIDRSGLVVKYEDIYSKLWDGVEPKGGALRVYISKLKKYFDKNIKSIRGVGYIFKR